MAEYRVTLEIVVYVLGRDGDFEDWSERWLSGGCDLIEVGNSMADRDGRVGRGFLVRGPMRISVNS